MRFLLVFNLISLPFFSKAQKDSADTKVTVINDSLFMIALKIGKKTFEFKAIKTLDKQEQDSLKKGIVPLKITHQMGLDAIRSHLRAEENTFKKDLENLKNAPIPDFDARDTEGVLHRPAQYFGRVWMLHFWNFWDSSFDNELPILNDLLKKYEHQGLQILSFVDLEIAENEKAKFTKSPISFPLIQNSRQFMHQFIKIRHSTPYLILVDKQGKMRLFYIQNELNTKKSAFYNGDFEGKIKELMSEN
jgi:hypothetical protein